jgi:Cu/Ag efflux pump CusA
MAMTAVARVLVLLQLLLQFQAPTPRSRPSGDCSSLDPLLVLVSIPFSLAGGLFALYAWGIRVNVSAVVGFISLFGVAVMSGLLYVAEMNRRRHEPGSTLSEAVMAGARAQFRPCRRSTLPA